MKTISTQCPYCGHWDSWEQVSAMPIKCDYCGDWYAIESISNHNAKSLTSYQAILLMQDCMKKEDDE